MLTREFPFLAPQNIDPDGGLERRLGVLARDIVRIRTGAAPSRSELSDSPHLDGWATVLTPVGIRLIGQVTGHPRLGECRAMTSQLWAADPQGRWIRTLSRFYRLGAQAGGCGQNEGQGDV